MTSFARRAIRRGEEFRSPLDFVLGGAGGRPDSDFRGGVRERMGTPAAASVISLRAVGCWREAGSASCGQRLPGDTRAKASVPLQAVYDGGSVRLELEWQTSLMCAY